MKILIIVILSILIIISILTIISLTVMSSRMTRLEEDTEYKKLLDEWYGKATVSNNYNKDGNEV